jgi:hypothetical protein
VRSTIKKRNIKHKAQYDNTKNGENFNRFGSNGRISRRDDHDRHGLFQLWSRFQRVGFRLQQA